MNQAEVKRKQIQLYSYVACVLILLYFGKMLQNSGLTFLTVALGTVLFFQQLCVGSFADVIGRMIRYRRKRGLYTNVCTVRRRLACLLAGVGVLCFGLVFGLADVFAKGIFQVPSAGVIIRILSPILLIKTVGCILQGHFQSFGSHVQTAISYLLRPILYFFLGKGFAEGNLEYGQKVSVLLRNEDFCGMYSAVGLATGMVISELIILVVLVVFYFISDRDNDKKKSKDGLQKKESWQETFGMFGKLSIFGVGVGALGYLMLLLVMLILKDKMQIGIYGGQYLMVCAIPVLLVCARYYLLYAKTIYAVKGQNNRHIREIIQTGIKYAWCFGILACVIVAVLAPQIAAGFFERSLLMEEALQKGSLWIPFLILWIYFIMVNMAHNKHAYALLAVLVNTILCGILGILLQGKMEVELIAVITAISIATAVSSILLGIITTNLYRLQIEYIYTYILPLACAGVVGLILMVLSKLLTPHIGNEVCFYVCTCIGIVLYLVFLSICRIFGERDINQIFGKFGRKCLSVFFK